MTEDGPPGGYRNIREANNAKLTLASGTVIHLRCLKQREVYESDSSFVFVPDTELNDRLVERVVKQERNQSFRPGRWNRFRKLVGLGSTDAPFVVPPTQIPVESDYPMDVMLLPAVVCIGHFTSKLTRADAPVENISGDWAWDEKGCSELVIIWFQDEYAFPIAPEILEKIQAIDWHRHATNKRIWF